MLVITRVAREGSFLTASTPSDRTLPGAGRVSFAHIREPLEVPDLLSLQIHSMEEFLGSQLLQR